MVYSLKLLLSNDFTQISIDIHNLKSKIYKCHNYHLQSHGHTLKQSIE